MAKKTSEKGKHHWCKGTNLLSNLTDKMLTQQKLTINIISYLFQFPGKLENLIILPI